MMFACGFILIMMFVVIFSFGCVATTGDMRTETKHLALDLLHRNGYSCNRVVKIDPYRHFNNMQVVHCESGVKFLISFYGRRPDIKPCILFPDNCANPPWDLLDENGKLKN